MLLSEQLTLGIYTWFDTLFPSRIIYSCYRQYGKDIHESLGIDYSCTTQYNLHRCLLGRLCESHHDGCQWSHHPAGTLVFLSTACNRISNQEDNYRNTKFNHYSVRLVYLAVINTTLYIHSNELSSSILCTYKLDTCLIFLFYKPSALFVRTCKM